MDKKHLIDCTKWEQMQKEDFQMIHAPFQAAIEKGDQRGYDFQSFTQDLFNSFYKVDPQISEETSPGRQWQKEALETMKELREYKDIRKAGTIMDGFQSGLGATVLAKHFSTSLPQMNTPNPDELQEKIKMYEDFLEQYENHPQMEEISGSIKSMKAKLPEAQKEWEENRLTGQDLRMALRAGLSKAHKEVQEAEEAANPFGYGTSPGEDGYSDPKMKLALAEKVKNNPKLRQIAELAGRFRREARKAQASKKQPGPEEIADIEVGAELNRILPTELAQLRHPLRKLDFARKMYDRGLLQYRLEEVEKKDRGPIIVCVDDSASMRGMKEVWSKAVALAMCQIAIDQKRTFEILHFTTEVTRADVFPAGKVDAALLVDSMSTVADGAGTAFNKPLATALRHIAEAAEKDLRDADVVFITDGAAPLSSSDCDVLNAAKKATGASVYTICLGSHAPSLDPVSDRVFDLRGLATPEDNEAAKEIIFSV